MNDALKTTVAHASVAGDVTTVYAAVERLIEQVWPGMAEVVIAEAPGLILHRVSTDGQEIDAWLTWELTPVGPSSSWTELRLLHEELDTLVAPPPELDRVLELLLELLGSKGHGGTTDVLSTSN